MEDIAKVFITNFLKNAKHILTPDIVRKVYDHCNALTSTMINNSQSVLSLTLQEMARYCNVIAPRIVLEKERIDIALCGSLGGFIIPVEVENNSGGGKRDDIIFSTEIAKLVKYHGKLMVFITYDYNEEYRQLNSEYGNWRFNFTKRLEEFLDREKPEAPFLFIVGNTPRYAGKLNSYPDKDCIVNWALWIKSKDKAGYWYKNEAPVSKRIENTPQKAPTKKPESFNLLNDKTETIYKIYGFLNEKCEGIFKTSFEEGSRYPAYYGFYISKHGKGWVLTCWSDEFENAFGKTPSG